MIKDKLNSIENLTFVKWAGGKGQLLEQIEPNLPNKIERYFEPFVGGGALFFYIIQKYKPKSVYISDVNGDLIKTYLSIRDNLPNLIKELKKHQKEHKIDLEKYGKTELEIIKLNKLRKKEQGKKLDKINNDLDELKKKKKSEMPKRYYYIARNSFNKNKDNLSDVEIAGYFIYFNKTCFNGIFRVNPKGEFNVPKGDPKEFIFDENRLKKTSEILKNDVQIEIAPYSDIEFKVKKGDFIYFDPPYHPLSKTSKFTSYTKFDFLDIEQKELSEFYKKLDKKGCKLMLSNNNTQLINNLYEGFNFRLVKSRRSINSNGLKRGEIDEILITNFKV